VIVKTLEYHSHDKSKWADGPWQSEPDKKQWTDQGTGLPCLIVRNGLGALCGYVGVSEGHPLFGLDYSDCYENPEGEGAHLDVHGGLTYASFCMEEGEESHRICHLVEPGENDRVWWLGFDTAHAGDLSPRTIDLYRDHGYFDKMHDEYGYTYKTIEYVEAECAKLAAQLVAMA
jgi:hypothetical protein